MGSAVVMVAVGPAIDGPLPTESKGRLLPITDREPARAVGEIEDADQRCSIDVAIRSEIGERPFRVR